MRNVVKVIGTVLIYTLGSLVIGLLGLVMLLSFLIDRINIAILD